MALPDYQVDVVSSGALPDFRVAVVAQGATPAPDFYMTANVGPRLPDYRVAIVAANAVPAPDFRVWGLAVAPANTVAPVISGTPAVGQTLTATTGTWTGSPSGYAYQWKSGATNVGTNANTYPPVSGDAGANITCVVTATNAGGSAAATSNSLGPVVAAGLVADILLDFVNGIYRVDGTTYATAALAGFTGAGTFNASGYTPTGSDKLTGVVSLPGDFILLVKYQLPIAGAQIKTLTTDAATTSISLSTTGDITTFPVAGADSTTATKTAFGRSGGVAKKSFDGGSVFTGGTYAAPGTRTFTIGNTVGGVNAWTQPIALWAAYKQTLTDAQIQALI